MRTSTLLLISCFFTFLLLNQIKANVEADQRVQRLCSTQLVLDGKCGVTQEEKSRNCKDAWVKNKKPGPAPNGCDCLSNNDGKNMCTCKFLCLPN